MREDVKKIKHKKKWGKHYTIPIKPDKVTTLLQMKLSFMLNEAEANIVIIKIYLKIKIK